MLFRKIFALAYCTVGTLLIACSPSPPQQSAPTPTMQYSQFQPLVDEYVHQKHGWSPDDYRIEFNRWEGTTLVYWVLNREDEKTPQTSTGGGKSFEVWVDPSSQRIVNEYHFQ